MANPTHSDHITKVRQAATKIIDAVDDLTALKAEYDALDLGSALTVNDFEGSNAHLNVAAIAAVEGTTLSAIKTLMAQGHATNLYKVKA